MRRVRIRPFHGVLLFVLAGCLTVFSEPSESTEASPKLVRIPDDRAGAREAATRARMQREELSRRIQAAVEQSGKVIAGLGAQAATLRDPNLRLALDRRIAQAKSDLQIELLRVKANFARETGRAAQAQELEAEIAAATKPKISKSATPSGTTSATPSTGGAR